MALREFTDGRGSLWRVWETRPASGVIRPQFAAGWLTFECEERRRRLAYIPEGWAALDDEALRALCIEAKLEERAARRVRD